MMSVTYAECHYVKCRYAKCRYAKCRGVHEPSCYCHWGQKLTKKSNNVKGFIYNVLVKVEANL